MPGGRMGAVGAKPNSVPPGEITAPGTVSTVGGNQIYKITESGDVEVTGGSVTATIFVIGGGGGSTGGVSGTNYGAGGGAGVVRQEERLLQPGIYPVTVGVAGSGVLVSSASQPGGSSFFDDLEATGGNGTTRSTRTGGSNADFVGGTNSSSTNSGGGAGSTANGNGQHGGTGLLAPDGVTYAQGGAGRVSGVLQGGNQVGGTTNTGHGAPGMGGGANGVDGGSGVVLLVVAV